MELRKALKDNLVRGHVDLALSVDRTSQQKAGYNRELVAGYIAAFNAARDEFGLSGEPDLNAVLRLPGALQNDSRGDEELTALAESVRREIVPLLDELKIMRAREGEALEAILHGALDRLTEATDGVAELRPEIEQRYQERLAQRLLAATGPDFNRQRLLEEVAVIVERSDIAEELARMHTHIGHFRELLAAGGEVGKKLDFLLQEMNREANTLLSKTGLAGGGGTRITELGLAMKAEIEKAREQIQNVE
ncbi:MAG TPA: YicC/YloC family endoribonuclease, partial [Terracidiphilus sp.]